MTVRALLCLLIASAALAGEARATFFNQKVSARTIALNQPVRIELTTVPRQVEGVNIEASVADAVTLGAASGWRLVGKPGVTTDEKTKTIRVAAVLLPRLVGERALPVIPIAWLGGDQSAEFGVVKVEPRLVSGDDSRPLPAELDAVGGYAWGCKYSDVRDRLPPGAMVDGEKTVAKPQPGLELTFRRDELVEAAIDAGDLTVESARASLLDRWGPPQIDENGTITWVLGWTRISATAAADGKGMRVQFVREDLIARITRGKVAERVFGLLDGPKPAAPAADPAKPAPPSSK